LSCFAEEGEVRLIRKEEGKNKSTKKREKKPKPYRLLKSTIKEKGD